MGDESVMNAVRYYIIAGGIDNYNDQLLYNPFIPIFNKDDLIHLHSPSIVRFCHVHRPEEFKELTQTKFCQIFTEGRVIHCDKISHSFRVISMTELNRMMK